MSQDSPPSRGEPVRGFGRSAELKLLAIATAIAAYFPALRPIERRSAHSPLDACGEPCTKVLHGLAFFFFILFGVYTHSWADQSVATLDAIENIRIDPQTRNVHIIGRANSEILKNPESELQIEANWQSGKIIKKYIEEEKISLEAVFIPPLPGGLFEVKLSAISPTSGKIGLRSVDGGKIQLHVPQVYSRHWILLGTIVLVIFLASAKWSQKYGETLSAWVQRHVLGIAAGIFLCFLSLVAIGVTGGSLRIVLEGPVGQSVSTVTGSNWRIFEPQHSRGDEWGILMPNVLAQIHHEPPFPIINTHLGMEGQNMGVLGMTGVPIAQLSAVARPATWGYFFLPLRQAQSWQWQLPFWGCLLALWWLLNILRPLSAGRNLALSFLFCIAPYAAAWSNWPLYFTLFPTLAFIFFTRVCKAKNPLSGLGWGLGLGYAVAAWVLTLYPPWMISIGTLLAFLAAGWLRDKTRHEELQKSAVVAGVVAALAISTTILASWWMDTRDAITLMRNTVYPGQRAALTGGDASFLWAFRGYTNAEIISFGNRYPKANQPEFSSYIWAPFLLAWLCFHGWVREKSHRWLLAGIAAFSAYYFIFLFVGIPEWLAKASQWSRVPTFRIDVSLGLAFTILLCLVQREWFGAASVGQRGGTSKGSTAALVALSVAMAIAVLIMAPATAFPTNSAVYVTAVSIFIAFFTAWLAQGKTAGAMALLGIFFLASSLGFNPIAKAPKSVEMNPETRALASDAHGRLQRTLLVNGEAMGAHFLSAVGLPVVNGVLAYPQREFWNGMRLPQSDWHTVNRYQHLAFVAGKPSNGASYSVSSPWPEWVLVTIDTKTFNFERTGAQRVAAVEDQAVHLRKSPMLQEIATHHGLTWFMVNPAP